MAETSSVKIDNEALRAPVCTVSAHLKNDLKTTIYAVRHARRKVRPRVVVFEKPTCLLGWCVRHNIMDGVVGGYDLHHTNVLLGDVWTAGVQHPSEPVAEPWHMVRGSAYISPKGDLSVEARDQLPKTPKGDLLQAGPLLVKNGVSLIKEGASSEGFSETAYQFSPDPSVGRHPRAAIGYDDDYIWTVACDGRKPGEAGLYLSELADVMIAVGASDALNLDGGSSTQLVHKGELLNDPWGQHQDHYPDGLPISTALVFESR